MYIDQVLEIPDAIRDAVLTKWLNYVKSENLTEWVIWRKHLMNFKLSKADATTLKMGLATGRKSDKELLMFKDKTDKTNSNFPKGMCHKDSSLYGEKVNKIFPILDPNLADDD
jgi:hypothetical protein